MPNDDSLLALDAMEGCDYEAACARLHDMDYRKIGEGTEESTVFYLEGTDQVIRLFQHENIPAAMDRLGEALPNNPFLPVIHGYKKLSDTAYALVMEKLVHPDTFILPGRTDMIPPYVGAAHAFRNFPLGNPANSKDPNDAKDHSEFFSHFNKSSKCTLLDGTLRAIAKVIEDSCCGNDGNCLRLNDRSTSRILLRPLPKGGYQHVYADPLTIGRDLKMAREHMTTMISRCDTYLKKPVLPQLEPN